MDFPPLGNSDHVVVLLSIDFSSYSQRDASFDHVAYDYFRTDQDGLYDRLRDVLCKDIFKLSASAAASEFCEWVQVGIDVYIPLHLHRFQLLVLLPLFVEITFFQYQKGKSSESKVKFRQASNCRER